MTEYELDQICQRIVCDCKCMSCPLMAKFQRSELGLDEGYDDYDYDDEYKNE